MSTYNILALDGGGSRGVISACMLEALQDRVPDLIDRVDLFVGSSIGAANAFALAQRGTTDGMVEFYREYGRVLFSERYLPPGILGYALERINAVPLLGRAALGLESLFYPKWSNDGLRHALAAHFGECTRLSDLERKVMAPTLRLHGHQQGAPGSVVESELMSNFEGNGSAHLPLSTALLRTMSAPVYFESTPDGYVDGGVFMVSPGLAAIGVALRCAEQELDDVRMLSIGTGVAADGMPTQGSLAWGRLKWGEHFPGVSTRAVTEIDDRECDRLLNHGGESRYLRLDPPVPRAYPVDDFRAIEEMICVTNLFVGGPIFENAVDFVREHFAH